MLNELRAVSSRAREAVHHTGGGDWSRGNHPVHTDYEVGDMVEVYWLNEKEYYAGKVRAVNRSKRTISVDYDDGDFDANVHWFEARRKSSAFAKGEGLAEGMGDYVVEMTRK